MTEHPYYGTCPRCLQVKRVKRDGFMYEHNRQQVIGGSMVATLRCLGGRYVEYMQDNG